MKKRLRCLWKFAYAQQRIRKLLSSFFIKRHPLVIRGEEVRQWSKTGASLRSAACSVHWTENHSSGSLQPPFTVEELIRSVP